MRCLAALAVAIPALAGAAEGFVQAKGRWLVDPQGRVLILHGVNVANASKRRPYLPWQTRAEFEQIARWGFNSVRLLTVWTAIEPEPGRYDDAYIERLAERVRWCRELGLWVILDMHQDLYSEQYGGDGAPAWACLDDGLKMGPRNRTWFLNYLQPPVIKAFDRFWANAAGPGDAGLQERFAAAWQHLAHRFRDEPTLIGYDLLNEPFPSPVIQAAILSYANAVAKLTTAETKVRFLQALTSPEPAKQFAEVAQAFRDPQVVERLIQEGGGPIERFERETLLPFYGRVVRAIRAVDPHHICFIEPTALGGAVRTGLARPTDAEGEPFANLAFAPHYYEAATELGLPYEGNRERLRALIGRICHTARALEMPVWFGECGNVSARIPNARDCIADLLDALNERLASWCYWEYGRGFAKLPYLDLLTRPYPTAVAGEPIRLRVAANSLELSIQSPLPGKDTLIWLPPRADHEASVRTVGGQATTALTPSGAVAVRCSRGTLQCHLRLRYALPDQF